MNNQLFIERMHQVISHHSFQSAIKIIYNYSQFLKSIALSQGLESRTIEIHTPEKDEEYETFQQTVPLAIKYIRNEFEKNNFNRESLKKIPKDSEIISFREIGICLAELVRKFKEDDLEKELGKTIEDLKSIECSKALQEIAEIGGVHEMSKHFNTQSILFLNQSKN